MSLPTCTPADLDALIQRSGYPFELEVAQVLANSGFEVELSHQFLHPTREHPSEIDILATRRIQVETAHAGLLGYTLELIVECKDNALPYVLFGFPHAPTLRDGSLDGDVYFCKVRTTDDDIPEKFRLVALGDDRLKSSPSLKASHHQFNTPFRFRQVSAVEPKNGALAFNVSERLRSSLHGLAGYIAFVNEQWKEGVSLFRSGMPYDPAVWISFLLLVHSGEHYRYTGPGSLTTSPRTTLFTSLNDNGLSVPYAVDFVQFEDLAATLDIIDATFQSQATHLSRYLTRSPKPFPGGA
jgi:hypothetical protein